VLEAIRLASLKFWNWIVRLAPIGVFALFAVTAGTTALRDLVNLSLYLVLFLLGAFVLAFWMLPAILSALAPIGGRELLREVRAGLTIAAVTTLSVAALPFVTEATRRLTDRCGVKEAERDDVIRTNLSVAYPLGQIGNFFVDFSRIDAAIWTLEQAEMLARAHPGITAVVPKDFGSPFLFSYLMPPDSGEFANFVNYWLELRRADGFRQQQFDYWIKGQPRASTEPRWSVIHDVLHWVK
jgi:hypothetical protein